MSTRTTRKDAERALNAYCAEANLPRGHYLFSAEPITATPSGHPVALLREVPDTPSTRPGYLYVIPGGLAIDCAYGGYEVQEIDGTPFPGQGPGPCTGVRCPFGSGHVTAREIVAQLRGARFAVADLKAKANR